MISIQESAPVVVHGPRNAYIFYFVLAFSLIIIFFNAILKKPLSNNQHNFTYVAGCIRKTTLFAKEEFQCQENARLVLIVLAIPPSTQSNHIWRIRLACLLRIFYFTAKLMYFTCTSLLILQYIASYFYWSLSSKAYITDYITQHFVYMARPG